MHRHYSRRRGCRADITVLPSYRAHLIQSAGGLIDEWPGSTATRPQWVTLEAAETGRPRHVGVAHLRPPVTTPSPAADRMPRPSPTSTLLSDNGAGSRCRPSCRSEVAKPPSRRTAAGPTAREDTRARRSVSSITRAARGSRRQFIDAALSAQIS
jgi:hypothetical protein